MYDTDQNTPKAELEKRIERLRASLRESGLDGALILQNTDLFYFAGTMQQSHLYVPAQGDPLLMVRKSLERAMAESSLGRIAFLGSPKQIPDLLKENGHEFPRKLGMELDVLPANAYLRFQGLFEQTEISDISHGIRMTRAVKSDYEIRMIRKAAQLSDQLAGCMRELAREGITEVALAGRIEAEARKLGHQGIVRMRLWGAEMFYGHLMAGPSAAVPSFLASPTGGPGVSPAIAQGPGLNTIRPHEPILLDYCFVHNGYVSDHTRIFSIGDLPDDLLKAHEAMLDVQALVKKEAKPQVPSGQIYDIAVERARELGYADHFMGVGDQRIRFVGHGLGLELDEYPFLAKGQSLALEKGMTLALEPKLIFPGKGVVGIENTHVVTDEGLEQLTHFEEGIVAII